MHQWLNKSRLLWAFCLVFQLLKLVGVLFLGGGTRIRGMNPKVTEQTALLLDCRWSMTEIVCVKMKFSVLETH